jgi:Ca2+/Na+ antiporter
MEKNNPMTFTMSIVAIIVGVALYKQIDFKTMTVEKPALSVLYAVVFLFAVFVLAKNFRKKAEK